MPEFPMLTASKLSLAKKCPGSFALPHVGRISEAADKGTAKHDALDEDPKAAGAILAVLGLAPAASPYLRKMAYALDVDSGEVRTLTGDGREAYRSCGPREIGGRADLILPAETLTVIDWKSGRPEFVEPAATNQQLDHYAYCAAKVGGYDGATKALVYLREEEIALDTMRSIVDRIEVARAEVHRGRPPPATEGDHCRWCPAFSRCPAKTSLVRAAFADPAAIVSEVEGLAPDWGKAWGRYKLYKDALREVERTLYGAARQPGGFQLPNGRCVREVVKRGDRVIDGDKAEPVLAGLFGAEQAAAMVKRSCTQADIKKLAGTAGLTKAMDALESAGAVGREADLKTVKEVEP
jgi:hypothetical protein